MLLAGALFAAGCTTGDNSSGLNLITPQGSHPAGFASTHPSLILSPSDTSLCQPCHGDALRGGIANVSCFSASRNGAACHPAGTHVTDWMNIDNFAAFHGTFAPGPPTCAKCHPIAGHPTCTTCHFNDSGSRDSGLFTHGDPFNHGGGQVSVGNICENCHQTSRIFRAGSPPSCLDGPGGAAHPGNEGCHSDTVINQTLTNPRF
jgi:hypothetical protein